MKTPKELLEAYVQAKDGNQPALMADIYAPDAVLTFSNETDTIAFPARTEGADGIEEVLVRDLRSRFDHVKTWYVCDAAPPDGKDIAILPWLVIMQQMSNGALRIGKGYYRWSFASYASATQVTAMHIHIERMDVIEDHDGKKREALQAALAYPWLRPVAMHESFRDLMRQHSTLAFLRDFLEPVGRAAR